MFFLYFYALPLWSSGQSSWLQMQRSWFDSRRYQIFWVVGLERVHSASWVQLRSYLKRKSSCSGLESLEYGRRDPLRWPRGTLYPQKLALTSPPIGGRSAGTVRSRAQVKEFSLMSFYVLLSHVLHTLISSLALHVVFRFALLTSVLKSQIQVALMGTWLGDCDVKCLYIICVHVI
jgi:hypothetical protein